MRQDGNGGNGIKGLDCVNKYFGGCIKLRNGVKRDRD